MQATIDSRGRIVVPMQLRDELGLVAGSTVEIGRYGAELRLVPGGPTARIVEVGGVVVATSETEIDDDIIFRLLDEGRR